jgi:hypothetical protein
MTSYPIGIVGESFTNEDGTSRQHEIARCRPGEPVTLERDPQNKHDARCVKVMSARGVQIGNISRDDSWICERLDRGAFLDARIMRVGQAAKGKSGVVICVRSGEEDEWLEESGDRPSGGSSTGCSVMLFAMLAPPAAATIGSLPR